MGQSNSGVEFIVTVEVVIVVVSAFFVISLIVHRWKFKFDFKENFTPFCEGESILRAVWLSVNVEQPNPGCVKFCHNPILVFCKTFQFYALREAEKQIVI